MSHIDDYLDNIRERKRIRCPHCNEVNEDDEYEFVSMYGTIYNDDGLYEHECGWCGKVFFIHELVDRTYTTGKTHEEASLI
jgi:DNA-directed RNA polymerase subunit RPC12/RpoP